VGILRSGWVGGAQRVCEGEGLTGGQVVDGDFVSLPIGAGEDDVAADRRVGIVRGSFQAEAALLHHYCDTGATGSRARVCGRHAPRW
jgi:hypothetical protein